MSELTDEELVLAWKNGQKECVDILLERYRKMVKTQARALYLCGGDRDDLQQEGMIGLVKAIRDYEPTKNDSFAPFARLCVSRQLYKAIQASNRQKHAPLNSYVELTPELAVVGELPGERRPEEELIERERVSFIENELTDRLSKMERQVLDHYIEGDDYQVIAEKLGKSPKSIDNALQRIRKKTSQLLENV